MTNRELRKATCQSVPIIFHFPLSVSFSRGHDDMLKGCAILGPPGVAIRPYAFDCLGLCSPKTLLCLGTVAQACRELSWEDGEAKTSKHKGQCIKSTGQYDPQSPLGKGEG